VTAPTVPDTADGLAEALTNAEVLKGIKDNGGLKPFLAKYTEQFQARDKGVTEEQIKEQFEKQIVDYFRENEPEWLRKVNLAAKQDFTDRGQHYAKHAPGAKLDEANLFNSNAEFLKTIWHLNESGAAAGLRTRIRNDYSSTVPADGGFLVPESFRSTLLQESLESAIIRPRAMVIPMEAARVSFPALEVTSHATSVFGGMIAYWTEEAAKLIKASAKFSKVVLDAKKLTGYSVVPNELLTDSIISLEAFIQQSWPAALAWTEDLAFLNGTGVGEPFGAMRAGAMVTSAKEGGQSANTIVWENIVKMYARMLPTSLGSAVWLANINTFPELATMALNVGTGGGPVWLNNGVEGPPATILGRPVFFTEKMQTLGTAGDLAFVDLKYYMIGDRQTMQMASSTDIEFDTDQTAYRIIQRVDGRPWLQSAVTPNKGADTLSPFVQLATRA
jgi:HK97 family phage major capsid protein